MKNIYHRFNKWFDKWFGPYEITCSECGEKYIIGVPGLVHKCSMKAVVKKALLELEEEKKK